MVLFKKPCDLSRCFFCQSCLKDWLPALSAHRLNFKVKKGERLFSEGDQVKGIFFVYEGLVKVHKKWSGDKELILRFAGNGAIVGHRGLGGDSFYPVSATALETTTVCFIDLAFFQRSLRINHEFALGLLDFFATELRESEKHMRNMAHMPVKGRLAAALLLLAKNFGVTTGGFISIVLSRQDMASYVGATYETVFRTLTELAAGQVISLSGKDIRILDEKTLVSLCNEAAG